MDILGVDKVFEKAFVVKNQYKRPNNHKGTIFELPVSIPSFTTQALGISRICFFPLDTPPISSVNWSSTKKSP
ncbi:MAG: hypothetical protein RLZZ420_2330 [Bacteroidota bacterium]|jgi:hypothetical protein